MAFYKQTIETVPIHGKTILVRADYNVPLNAKGAVDDDYRIRMNLPTIKKLLNDGCKVVVISHLGRPDGKKNMAFSLEPAALRLAELLGEPVRFVDNCIGDKVKMAIKRAPKHSVTVLENLRFYPGEEANDPQFAKQLAAAVGADYFVQDGFGVVHRAHASTQAITLELPSVAGLLLEREYTTITSAMKDPKRPLVAVLGGAKVSDKIPVIKKFVDIADQMVIGGAMGNTFLANKGVFMGNSKIEPHEGSEINEIDEAVVNKVGRDQLDAFLQLPVDVGVGTSVNPTATRQDVSIKSIPAGTLALDIGPESTKNMLDAVKKAKTVIWNGALGMSENPVFATASAALAQELANNKDITSIIGGGDTADFVIHWDKQRGGSFTHVSTGGGASLELMSGEKLPGIEALLDAH